LGEKKMLVTFAWGGDEFGSDWRGRGDQKLRSKGEKTENTKGQKVICGETRWGERNWGKILGTTRNWKKFARNHKSLRKSEPKGIGGKCNQTEAGECPLKQT